MTHYLPFVGAIVRGSNQFQLIFPPHTHLFHLIHVCATSDQIVVVVVLYHKWCHTFLFFLAS